MNLLKYHFHLSKNALEDYHSGDFEYNVLNYIHSLIEKE